MMQFRLIQVLSPLMQQQAALSLALLEEAEMMLQVVVPLFWHSDLWAEIDIATFSNVKDCLLFAVPWLAQTAAVVPSSQTEQHLQQVVSGSKTLLQVKTDMT